MTIMPQELLFVPGPGTQHLTQETTSLSGEAVCVVSGSLAVRGRETPSGGALIVESGVPAQARSRGRSKIAHFGRVQPGDGSKTGCRLHIGGPRGAAQFRSSELSHSDW